VQEWWRSKQMAGASIPPGADAALVCPFSQRTFGDMSQLVTHWAAALPRAADPAGSAETPSVVASNHFARLSSELRWADMTAAADLDEQLPSETPRAGSVWEQVLSRTQKQASEGQPARERPVAIFVKEVVRLKCWRRDQKIEHREVMEGIASGLAIVALAESLVGCAAPWELQSDDRGAAGIGA